MSNYFINWPGQLLAYQQKQPVFSLLFRVLAPGARVHIILKINRLCIAMLNHVVVHRLPIRNTTSDIAGSVTLHYWCVDASALPAFGFAASNIAPHETSQMNRIFQVMSSDCRTADVFLRRLAQSIMDYVATDCIIQTRDFLHIFAVCK